MKVLYDTILKAKYTGRPNRFVVTLDLNGESVLAHLLGILRIVTIHDDSERSHRR